MRGRAFSHTNNYFSECFHLLPFLQLTLDCSYRLYIMAFNSEDPLCKEVSPDQSPRPKRIRKTLDHFFLPPLISESEYNNEGHSISDKLSSSVDLSSQNSATVILHDVVRLVLSPKVCVRSGIPDIWSGDIWAQKKELYPWLFYQNRTLGCLIYQNFHLLECIKGKVFILLLNCRKVLLIIMEIQEKLN